MDALIAVEPHEMEPTITHLEPPDCVQQHLVLVEAPVRYAAVYLLQGLPDDPACPHGQVTGLAATLGALGDTDGVSCTT